MGNTPMPWIKLYTELLDDPKIGRMADSVKLRFIQLLLIAGECDSSGCLINGDTPLSSDEIAWRLRVDVSVLMTDINTLCAAGLIERCNDTFCIKNFAKRQGRPQFERQAKWRETQKVKRENARNAPPAQENIVIDDTKPVTENVIDDTTVTLHPRVEKRREELVAAATVLISEIPETSANVSDSTQPTPPDPTTRTDNMAIQGKSHDLFFIPQRSPAENTVRGWKLPPHLEELSIEFVKLTGVTPKGGDKRSDKGVYLADAADWIKNGYTVDDMREAYQRCNGKFPITHLGALYRNVQEHKRLNPTPVINSPTRSDAFWFYTTSGEQRLKVGDNVYRGEEAARVAVEMGVSQ